MVEPEGRAVKDSASERRRGRPMAQATSRKCREGWYPRQESNLRTWFRKPLLYPLSYGGGCPGWRARLRADAGTDWQVYQTHPRRPSHVVPAVAREPANVPTRTGQRHEAAVMSTGPTSGLGQLLLPPRAPRFRSAGDPLPRAPLRYVNRAPVSYAAHASV